MSTMYEAAVKALRDAEKAEQEADTAYLSTDPATPERDAAWDRFWDAQQARVEAAQTLARVRKLYPEQVQP
jgi:hypothetical protein